MGYKYVLAPWKVMRRDVQAVAEKFAGYEVRLAAMEDATRTSRIIGLTDEEQARREKNMRFQQANRGA